MSEIFTYEHVEIAYEGVSVVRDVDFSVEEGEILGILGESGSGKTTLVRAAMGLLGNAGAVVRGAIWYGGRDLLGLGAAERRRVNGTELGMVFQAAGSSFCAVRTVGAQLHECLSAHGRITKKESRRRAVSLLQRLGFEDPDAILDGYPFELSGGMQQRVGIAAAMLLSPKVLFADEPTSALDERSRGQVLEEMRVARRDFGTTIVLVSHDVGVVRAMADRVLVMRHGEVVEYGDADEVLYAPRAAYTRQLLAAVPGRGR